MIITRWESLSDSNIEFYAENCFVRKLWFSGKWKLHAARMHWNSIIPNTWQSIAKIVMKESFLKDSIGLIVVFRLRTQLQSNLSCPDICIDNAMHNTINVYHYHYSDVIMGAMTPQITSHTIVYSTVYPGADKRKYQSSASLAFVRGIHRWPVNSPHKRPVTREIVPFDHAIMIAK